jgi:signal transduction histidine kinase
MTLKTRLAAMMVLVLVAVVAVQFVMAERERRELAARLAQLSGELDRSTSVFVQRIHAMAAGGGPEDLEALFAAIAPDSGGGHARSTVRVMVFADTLVPHAMPLPPPGEVAVEMFERALVTRDSSRERAAKKVVWLHETTSLAGRDSAVRRRFQRLQQAAGADSARDFVVNLPLRAAGSDSLYTVQMRYSYASLAEELSRSRRRSLVWLAALLALGATAAIVVAGQFTRPIRALEASFGRVEAGDLDVRVTPERRDEIGHLTTSFNDMVARLRESQRLAERLAQHEHLASLGRLAAGVAHEIRNPLNAILLNLQQMRDRVRGAAGAESTPPDGDAGGLAGAWPEFDKYHARIVGEIERLERMVSSFLDLAKTGELHCERIDLAAGLRGAVDLFRPVAQEHDVRLELDAPDSLPALADPNRLPAVWNNLLANALAAAPRGGRVTVRARADGDAITVEVSDDGPGIPSELRSQVWEPFHSGREGGTGLGLAIVRSTVESHGGSVHLDCPPGGGTRVGVRLPQTRATPEVA